MRIAVFGLGYVGAVSALCLARDGHAVVGCDVDQDKLDLLRQGRSPVREPGLDELAAAARARGCLQLTPVAAEACAQSDIGIVCVGTPMQSDGTPSLAALHHVIGDIGRALAVRPHPYLCVVRSTVLPGTTEAVATSLRALASVRVAFVPEFLREGSALADYDRAPLTVLGVEDDASAAVLRELYAGLGGEVRVTTLRVAELAKYATNAFHATKVAFANEIGRLAAAMGADAAQVMDLLVVDRELNVGPAYLRPGFAFGGPCLPKDLSALRSEAARHGVAVPMLDGVAASNAALVDLALERLLARAPRRVALLGIAFKPGTDDLRGSPLFELACRLVEAGVDLTVHDPDVCFETLIGENRRVALGLPDFGSRLYATAAEAIRGSDVIVVGQRRREFTEALGLAMPPQVVLDLVDSELPHGMRAQIERVHRS